jgi:hypothetical protein
LLGIPVRSGEDGDRASGTHLIDRIWRDAQKLTNGLVPRMQTLERGNARYTVTLREYFYKPSRNSEMIAWRRFADYIDAAVIEDYDYRPIALLDRMELYAGAEMNFGVPNGPFSILCLTDHPFMEWCDPHNKTVVEDFARHKMAIGDQIPWLNADQRQIWQTPTVDALIAEFEKERARQWRRNPD